jgi:hypothetical protein
VTAIDSLSYPPATDRMMCAGRMATRERRKLNLKAKFESDSSYYSTKR